MTNIKKKMFTILKNHCIYIYLNINYFNFRAKRAHGVIMGIIFENYKHSNDLQFYNGNVSI